jgi:hypothetical protein
MSCCFQLIRITSPAAWTMSKPLQRKPFDFFQHVFARQAKQLPVFVCQQGVIADAGKVQLVG